ncbi:hypothetical protein Tco_1318734 [Tanacetum coccineum]
MSMEALQAQEDLMEIVESQSQKLNRISFGKTPKVDRIYDEVLEGIHSIPPGIVSFDAESDLVESMLNRDISIDSSPKSILFPMRFAGELILPKSIPPEIEEVEFDPEGDILFLESLLYDNSSPRPPEALQANF